MNTILVGQLVVVMCLQLLIASLLWAGVRIQRNNATAEWEFRSKQTKDRREGHLQIMKALKGETYVGQISGLDIHEDTEIGLNDPVMILPEDPPAQITSGDDD